MGWAMLLAIVIVAAVLLWRLGVPQRLWTSFGAALMLGCAGYALQGHPGLPGAAPRPEAQEIATAPAVIALRSAMWGKFTEEAAYEVAFDALLRAQDSASAVKLAISGTAKFPMSAELWTDLGSALVTHEQGNFSPAAAFAFDRAIAIAPRHPAPRFFRGLARAQAGDFAAARADWATALALLPPRAPYRQAIAERLAVLDRVIAAMARRPGG